MLNTQSFRADANVRVAKYSVMVKAATNTSSQQKRYAAVPAGANALGILGVTVDHFVEPNFFIAQGTDPSTVTGTVPVAPYASGTQQLMGRPLDLQVNGVARCYCASVVAQGDELNIADVYGRVKTVSEATGTVVGVVGIAQHATLAINDVVMVRLSFYTKKT